MVVTRVPEGVAYIAKGPLPVDRCPLAAGGAIVAEEEEGEGEEREQERGRHERGHPATMPGERHHTVQGVEHRGGQHPEKWNCTVEERRDEDEADDRADVS